MSAVSVVDSWSLLWLARLVKLPLLVDILRGRLEEGLNLSTVFQSLQLARDQEEARIEQRCWR